MRPLGPRKWTPALAALGLLFANEASASNVTEFPDNGSEQMGRGGAWVARASDPLATMFNPAGLAGQRTTLTLQSNFIFHDTCFTRLKAASDTTQDIGADASGRYPTVCNEVEPTFNPQFGATLRISDRLSLGALVIGPASAGEKTYPDFIEVNGDKVASPTRYIAARSAGIVLFPTVGVGYEVIDNLRIGASVSWGFAKLKQSAATVALNSNSTTPDNDVKANLQVADYFIPGFTVGGLYSATESIDIAGFYKWSDAIRARGDVGLAANFYTRRNAEGDDRDVRYSDTIFSDCGTGIPNDEGRCGNGGNATVKFQLPMEAKIGIRYHKPRAIGEGPTEHEEVAAAPAPPADGASEQAVAASPPPEPKRIRKKHLRDPMATDVFDVELDLTWANNSAVDAIQIRFPGDPSGKGLLPTPVQGGEIPPNGDQTKRYNDVFGVRLGGDYNVLPDKLALRAGTFFESSALEAQYQHTDFAASSRFGLALGGSFRIKTSSKRDSGAIDIMVGYGHVFFAKMEREDRNASGLGALAGTSCNGSDPVSAEKCADGSDRYRTRWPVNLGTITNSLNVINVGASYRF